MTDIDIDALLAEASLPERTVALCLRGDLQAEWEDLQRQLDVARRAKQIDTDSLGDIDPTHALAERVGDLEQRMAAATLTLRLRALPQYAAKPEAVTWARLWKQHPLGEDAEERDRTLGINTATFFPALVKACTVSPTMTEARWDALLGKLSDGQYSLLTTAAWVLNRGDVDVPFSFAASQIRASSGNGSRQPPASESL